MSKDVLTAEERSAVTCGMRCDELTLDELTTVHGGMRWEDMRPSTNVEDRRGIPRRYHPRPQYQPPTKPEPRFEGDLPSQLGLDDLMRMGQRRRR
jgi:hypothetical protein